MSRGVEHRDSLPLDREEHISGDGGRDRRAVGLFTTEGEISGITTAIGAALLTQPATEITLTMALAFDGNNNPIYLGLAAKGSAKSAEVWQLRKLTFDGNSNCTDIQWADGNDNFDNSWDLRGDPTYS
jgi:hypothetical protein